jgi:hypothetical protein
MNTMALLRGNLLANNRLYLSLILAASLISAGCSSGASVDRLRKENPFVKDASGDASSIIVVAGRFAPLETPGDVDVTAMPFWKQYSLAPDNMAAANGIVSGFSVEQLSKWRDNGLAVAAAPLSQWPAFRADLIKTGAKEQTNWVALFKREFTPYELKAYRLQEETSVFIYDSARSPRGYTLPAGDCFFQISCLPVTQSGEQKNVLVKIVPAFRNMFPTGQLVETDFGYRKEYAEIVFDTLTLGGTLPNDYFICIACSCSKDKNSSLLGRIFLNHDVSADNYQLLLAMAPEVQTAAAIKSSKP